MDDFFPFLYINEKNEDPPLAQISLYIEEPIIDLIEKSEVEEERVAIIEIL